MEFNNFVEYVKENLRSVLPDRYAGAEISVANITKNGETVLQGLKIQTPDDADSPFIALDNYYDHFSNGTSLQTILKDISKIGDRRGMADIDVDAITDLSKIKDKISCRLVNSETNKDLLKSRPHTIKGEFAVTYTIDLNSDGIIPINNDLFKHLGISVDELHKIAMENLTYEPFRFLPMREAILDMIFPDGYDKNDPEVKNLMNMPESTKTYQLNGASDQSFGSKVLLNEFALKGISGDLHGDYIVLPNSVSDVVVIPIDKDIDIELLSGAMNNIPSEYVISDRLSSTPYVYDSKEGDLVRGPVFKERVMNRVIEEIIEAKQDVDQFIQDHIDTSDPDAMKDALIAGYIPINTKYGSMELEVENGRLEFDGISMGGSSELYYAISDIVDELGARYMQPELDEVDIPVVTLDKHDLMNLTIEKIKNIDTDRFINDYIDFSDKEELKEMLTNGYIPFNTDYGTMELSIPDGRLEYEGTSMGGDRDLFFKIQDIMSNINNRLKEPEKEPPRKDLKEKYQNLLNVDKEEPKSKGMDI